MRDLSLKMKDYSLQTSFRFDLEPLIKNERLFIARSSFFERKDSDLFLNETKSVHATPIYLDLEKTLALRH